MVPHRFGSPFLATLLVFAALNAVSYFVRSDRGILPGHARGVERIGFPWLVWQDGVESDRGFAILALGADGYLDYGALALNAALGLAAGVIVGLAATLTFKPGAASKPIPGGGPAGIEAGGPPQFSLRSLLIATSIVAIALAFQRVATNEARTFALAAIYLAGPSLVVCCTWAARGRRRTEQMVVACSALAILVGAALTVGTHTERGDFTRVLLGLYVYWVPQCVAMVAVHLAALALRGKASGRREPPGSAVGPRSNATPRV